MPYHGFETKVYTLAIGPERQKLNVQEYIITRIPHFRKALMNGDIEQEIHYIMEKDDPEAVATVLAFVRDGALPVLETQDQKLHTLPSVDDQIHDCIEAYIIALEWGLEAAQNAIIDKTCLLLRKQKVRNNFKVHFDPSTQAESFFYSKMYLLLCREIAYQMQKKVQQRPNPSLQSDTDVLTEVVGSFDWNWDILFSLTTHLLRPFKESPVDNAIYNPCSYHAHAITEACGKQVSGQSTVTTSSSLEGVVNHIEAMETKNQDERKIMKPRTWGDMMTASFSDPRTRSGRPDNNDSPLPSKSISPYQAKARALPGSPGFSAYDRLDTFVLDSDKLESNRTPANESTTARMLQEDWDSLLNEGSKMPSASTGVLTPKSSTVSAASQWTVHNVTKAT